MRTQRWLIALTLCNTALVAFLLLSRGGRAAAEDAAPVIRGRSLEIVDDRGRVRASIKVQPAETFRPTGRKYPDTVMFRLIDPHGRPEVKIGASEQGGGLSFVGRLDATQIQLMAEEDRCSLRLQDRNGRERVLRP
jgi:hypothetical protein